MPPNIIKTRAAVPEEGILNQAGRSWQQSWTEAKIVSLPGREAGPLLAAKGRVLIVEDDPLIASAVAMMVESELACESVTAPSVAKAADLIDARTSLGVLDVEVADGLTFPLALQLLRRGIPCVFVSGSDPARVPPELALTPFLRKPVSPRDLMAAARQYL
jgi:DNA-binding NtrC family response regulator